MCSLIKNKPVVGYHSFKIRDRSTGLFSSGGCCPKFEKIGKTWSTLTSLKSSLNLYTSYSKTNVPASWEIVVYVPCQETIMAMNIVHMKLNDVIEIIEQK